MRQQTAVLLGYQFMDLTMKPIVEAMDAAYMRLSGGKYRK